jgi:TatD DNase family protein
MWIDTHCHLDAGEFDADRDAVATAALEAGVTRIVIPGVDRGNIGTVRALAHRITGGAYALGIHPLFTPGAHEDDLRVLRDEIESSLDDPLFVGIGEIGLDYFVPTLDDARQQFFYNAQLKFAREFDLPVICHVRKSQDKVLKGLRVHDIHCGIAHAFNGSFQQAEAFIGRLAADLPLDAIVLETDAPDIAPAWLYKQRNAPDQVAGIAKVLAQLRGIDENTLSLGTTANAHAALPRLALASS